MEGNVVIATLAQANGAMKPRPAIVLRELPLYGDLLLCGISSKLHQQVSGFDEVISPVDADYPTSGLHISSLIRLGFLIVLPRRRVLGIVGTIAPERHERLLRKLSSYLVKDLRA